MQTYVPPRVTVAGAGNLAGRCSSFARTALVLMNGIAKNHFGNPHPNNIPQYPLLQLLQSSDSNPYPVVVRYLLLQTALQKFWSFTTIV